MADISIELSVQGIEKLEKFGNDAANALTDAISEALDDLRDDIENQTTQLCPVRTGRLRDSIDISVDDSAFSISAEAGMEYASFVDEGTRYFRGRHYFQQPIEKLFEQFFNQLDGKVQTSFDDISTD